MFWEYEIKNLCNDFGINLLDMYEIIKETEINVTKPIKGQTLSRTRYDYAQRKVMNLFDKKYMRW